MGLAGGATQARQQGCQAPQHAGVEVRLLRGVAHRALFCLAGTEGEHARARGEAFCQPEAKAPPPIINTAISPIRFKYSHLSHTSSHLVPFHLYSGNNNLGQICTFKPFPSILYT